VRQAIGEALPLLSFHTESVASKNNCKEGDCMMNGKLLIVLGMILALGVGAGCRSTKEMAETLEPALPPQDGVLYLNYPVQEGITVQVTLENQTAYNATQLGLFIVGHLLKTEKPVSVESPDFFPKYFSMINVDIEDGLLYISEKEATDFARQSYLEYQRSTAKVLYKTKPHQVLDNFKSQPSK
jgi:hypothetical protein